MEHEFIGFIMEPIMYEIFTPCTFQSGVPFKTRRDDELTPCKGIHGGHPFSWKVLALINICIGWFPIFFIFTPSLREMIQFRSLFFKWVGSTTNWITITSRLVYKTGRNQPT